MRPVRPPLSADSVGSRTTPRARGIRHHQRRKLTSTRRSAPKGAPDAVKVGTDDCEQNMPSDRQSQVGIE